MSEITRGTYGRFGTAVRPSQRGIHFMAWACEGETKADNAIEEEGPVWFNFGDTPEEALANLQRELDDLV